jgi:hypothetical protein
MEDRSRYPDIADIVARKARGRVERARLSFGDKLDILDKLRDDIAPIAQARHARVLTRPKNSKKAPGSAG